MSPLLLAVLLSEIVGLSVYGAWKGWKGSQSGRGRDDG